MSLIARLGVILGLDISEFTKGIDTATGKSKEFEANQRKQLRLAKQATEDMTVMFGKATVAAVGFGYVLAHAFEKADAISDVAKAFDLTIESLLATKGALQASGGEADNVTTLFSKLAVAQEEAKNGSDGLRESFAKLGITGKDVDKLNLNDLFKLVAQELSNVEDAGKRAAIAQELLGKAAKGVDWRDFVQNYKEFSNPALANAINDNAKAWDNIEKAMKNISMLVQALVQPFAIVLNYAFDLLDIWKQIKEGGDVSVDWGAAMGGMPGEEGATTTHAGSGKVKIKKPIAAAPQKGNYSIASASQEKFAGAIIQANNEYQKRLSLLNDAIGLQSKEISLAMQMHSMNADDYEIAKKTLDLNNNIQKLEADKIRELAAAQAEYDAQSSKEKNKKLLDEKIKDIKLYYDKAIPAQKELNKLIIDQLQTELDLKNKYIYQDLEVQKSKEREAIELNHSAQMDMLILESQSYKLRQNDFNLLKLRIEGAQQLAAIEIAYAEKRRDLQIEFERTAKTPKDRELFEEKIKNLNELQNLEMMSSDAINSKREENLLKDIERQQSWVAGWNDAFNKYVEASERASDRGKEAFQIFTSNMESALKNFVETGKLNFKDLIGTIIKQILVAQAVAQATSLFKMGVSSFASMFTGGSTSGGGMGSAASLLFSGVGKASGGYINSPTLVGENGPELFMPRTSGTVIPNGSWQQAAASMGNNGFTNNGTYIASMSAIDTQSATQFLASNKGTIWAAYQSANRSVPISR